MWLVLMFQDFIKFSIKFRVELELTVLASAKISSLFSKVKVSASTALLRADVRDPNDGVEKAAAEPIIKADARANFMLRDVI